MQDKPIILNSNISLLDAIKKLSNFVGESIPIIDKQSKKLIGIISENDVLAAFKISDRLIHEKIKYKYAVNITSLE